MDSNEQHSEGIGRPNDPDRITRLANVMYWAGCVMALIWLAFWLHAMSVTPYGDQGLAWGVTMGGAAVIWLIGRAIRYVWIGK